MLRNQDVNDIVKEHFPVSLELGVLAFLFALVFGIPLGVIAALKANTVCDYAAMFFSNVGFAVPSFLVATLLIYFFALKWGDITGLPTSGWDTWQSKILPVDRARASARWPTSRGSCAGRCSRRSSRTTSAPPGRRAFAGAASWSLHVLRNSLIPVVTAAGPLLGFLITGSFIIEHIFAIPGIGQYYVTAVPPRDYSVVMGLTVLLVVIIIVANLVVDILYGVPRPAHAGGPDLMVVDPAEQRMRVARAGACGRLQAAGAGAPIRQTSLWRTPGAATCATGARVIAGIIFLLLLPTASSCRSSRRTTRTRSTSPNATSRRAWRIPFGTDKFGRDLFTRTALGGRISIGIGFAATLVILVIGVDLRLDLGLRRRQARQRDDALPRRAVRAAVPAVRDHHARDLRRRSPSGRW